MPLRQLCLVGDSLTYMGSPQAAQSMVQNGGKGSWHEIIASELDTTAGVGPLLGAGVRTTARTSASEWVFTGTWTATVSTDAFDRGPYGDARYSSSGSGSFATWTLPTQWGRTVAGFAIYFIDYAAGGNWQYQIDGGAWTNMGQTLANDNTLAKFYVASSVTSTVSIRAFDGTNPAGVCLMGIEPFYTDPRGVTQGVIIHNIAKGGEPLDDLTLATSGDRMAWFDSVKVDAVHGGGAISNKPTAGILMMHVNDIRLFADSTKWGTDIATFYARVGSIGPLGYMSYGEMQAPTYDYTQQSNYRAQTKTSAALHSIPVLDHYDWWTSAGWGTGVGTQNAALNTQGLITVTASPVDNGHLTQAGNIDIAPKVYWFVRNNLLSLSSRPVAYVAKATQAAVAYKGTKSSVVYAAGLPVAPFGV